jgi:hypothetical protein
MNISEYFRAGYPQLISSSQRTYFVRFHSFQKTNSSFRTVFYCSCILISNEIWYVLISERLVYVLIFFTISEPTEARSHDRWVGSLAPWPSCYSADSFGDDADKKWNGNQSIFGKDACFSEWKYLLCTAMLVYGCDLISLFSQTRKK